MPRITIDVTPSPIKEGRLNFEIRVDDRPMNSIDHSRVLTICTILLARERPLRLRRKFRKYAE